MFRLNPEEIQALFEALNFQQMFNQAITTLVLLVVIYVLHRLIRYLISRAVHRPEIRQRYWGYSRLMWVIVGLMVLGSVWSEEVRTVGLLLTGLAAAFMIAGKEVLLGMAGRFSLAASGHYELGDRITINGVCGDVINIGLLYTWMLEVDRGEKENQGTGRVVVIPNLWLILHEVTNATHGHDYIFDEIELALPMDVRLDRAISIVVKTAEQYLAPQTALAALDVPRLSRSYAAKTPPVTPIAYARIRVEASGHQFIALTLRFSVRARERRLVHSQLSIKLLEAIRTSDISLYSAVHTIELLTPDTPPPVDEATQTEPAAPAP